MLNGRLQCYVGLYPAVRGSWCPSPKSVNILVEYMIIASESHITKLQSTHTTMHIYCYTCTIPVRAHSSTPGHHIIHTLRSRTPDTNSVNATHHVPPSCTPKYHIQVTTKPHHEISRHNSRPRIEIGQAMPYFEKRSGGEGLARSYIIDSCLYYLNVALLFI